MIFDWFFIRPDPGVYNETDPHGMKISNIYIEKN